MAQDDDQGSLLQYYSSGTTAHATYLLTLALIGAALLALGQILQRYVLISSLSIIVGASIWTGFRLLFWGSLSDAVIHVDSENCKSMDATNTEAVILARDNPKLYRKWAFRFGSNSKRYTLPLLVCCIIFAAAILAYYQNSIFATSCP
jgi:hypothetical protein